MQPLREILALLYVQRGPNCSQRCSFCNTPTTGVAVNA